MTSALTKLNRRDFLKKTGIGSAGLILHAAVNTPVDAAIVNSGKNGFPDHAVSLNVFVHIAEDDRVTIVAHRSEMGQGIRTCLPQVVADELDADWDKIDIVQAPGDEKYGDQNTDGSQSVRKFYQPMRDLGASAKVMLRQAAALRWQVPLESCVAKNHCVTHVETGKSLRYGELALAAAKLPVPDVNKLIFKSANEFKYIGKPFGMVDCESMVWGTALYGIDTVLPGMVYASIERGPIMGAKIASFDASQSLSIAGVLRAIKIDGGIEPAGFNPLAGVAIIATNTWAAMEGRKALKISWINNPAHVNYDSRASITERVKDTSTEGKVVRSRGDVVKAFADAAQTHSAIYSLPHLEHATMEPPAATARIVGNHCEVWACVQDPVATKKHVAGVLGFKPEQVTVNVTLLGGAFGRKAKPDFAAEAALLAKSMGKPVKVTWSREDTTRHGYYHAYSVQHYKAALDAQHRIIGLDSSVSSPSIASLTQANAEYMQDWELGQGFTSFLYNIPNFRGRNLPAPAHTRIGWLRSVYCANHAFGINSFMDELARLNKIDSLQFQLDTLNADLQPLTEQATLEQKDLARRSARLKKAIRAVQMSSGWPAPVAVGEGWGVAAFRSFDSHVAVASKVSLANGELRVLEVHIAIDCGQVINPDRVKAQMEGSVIFGLSAGLMGEITFKNGSVEQSSFDDYPLLRISQSPKIVVTIVESMEKHGGVGEPGYPPVVASIANAIVAAGGLRIRDLPINKHLKLA